MKTISLFLRDRIVIEDDEPKLDVRAVVAVVLVNLALIALLTWVV